MKNWPASLLGISGLFFVLLATSCRKIHPPKADPKICNIESMSIIPTTGGSLPPATYTFTYDAYGKPLSRINATPRFGSSSIFFFYDSRERLTNVISTYRPFDPINIPATFDFEYWIKYTYNENSKPFHPVADTFYRLGGYINGGICCTTPEINNYEFDAQGRISKIIRQTPPSPTKTEIVYHYDERGNLTGPGRVYDNKVNIHQTNPVWMLVDLEYSRNNNFMAETYNEYGLPSKVSNKNVLFLTSRGPAFAFKDATINYSCDSGKSK